MRMRRKLARKLRAESRRSTSDERRAPVEEIHAPEWMLETRPWQVASATQVHRHHRHFQSEATASNSHGSVEIRSLITRPLLSAICHFPTLSPHAPNPYNPSMTV